MIIGHYDSELWAKGGVSNYVRRIGAAQSALGHEVHYFSWRSPQSKTTSETIREIATDFPSMIWVDDSDDLLHQAQQRKIDILHVHKAIDPDLIGHIPLIRTIHGHHPYCPSGSQYLARTSQPCERTYHPLGCLWGYFIDRCGSIRPHNIQDNFRHTQTERRTLPRIPTLTVSNFLRDRLIQAGYPSDAIHTLHHFADLPPMVQPPPPNIPSSGIPHFLFVGRIEPQKGVDWLLRSIAQVPVPIHLDIAGTGGDQAAMEQLAIQLGIADRVTFHGWQPLAQIETLMTQARAVVFPSLWHEPAGLVPLEAMAQARAVIISQVGGTPEVIDPDQTGLLVAPNDIPGLVQHITHLAQDWHYAAVLGQAARSRIEQSFTLQQHLTQLLNFYQQAIAPRSLARSSTARSLEATP
jgi:glycosyltransferase involved in cell wall biosynthesis